MRISPLAKARRSAPMPSRAREQDTRPSIVRSPVAYGWSDVQMEARKKVNEAGNRSWAGDQGSRAGLRSQAKLWVAVGIAIAVVATYG